jgi:hypothetical protein
VLTALPTGFGCALTILREVARIVPGAAAAAAVLTAFAAGFSCPFPIVREIARAVLPADMSGARCLLAVFRKVPRISSMPLFGHGQSPQFVRLGQEAMLPPAA